MELSDLCTKCLPMIMRIAVVSLTAVCIKNVW